MRPLIAMLRDADWLDAGRARAYAKLVAAAMLVCVIVLIGNLFQEAWSDPGLRPKIGDFDAFWSAGYLAMHGVPQAAYDGVSLGRIESMGARIVNGQVLPFAYPPVFLMLCVPFAVLPYLLAAAAFELGWFAVLAWYLRRLTRGTVPMVAILAFPGCMINAATTQNGLVSAACFAGAALLLDRRPHLAGALLGVLTFKPHLAIGVPVALIAARRWPALAGCLASAGGLALLSWLAFGARTWVAFLAVVPTMRHLIEQDPGFYAKIVTLYGAIRVLHGPVDAGYTFQFGVAFASLAALAWAVRRRPGAVGEISLLVCATMLSTPYGMDYDLACLAVPIGWVTSEAITGGWRRWEKGVLACAYLLPAAARLLTTVAGLPVAPAILAALFGVTLSRARHAMADTLPLRTASAF